AVESPKLISLTTPAGLGGTRAQKGRKPSGTMGHGGGPAGGVHPHWRADSTTGAASWLSGFSARIYLTRKGSLVRSQQRPQVFPQVRGHMVSGPIDHPRPPGRLQAGWR